MLDAFIIEELKKREEERRRRERRPVLEIPVDEQQIQPDHEEDNDDYPDDQGEKNRGVVIIDFGA